MNDYISREDYCEENCGKENREGYKTCKNCGMLNIPTADVQPVKRGRWEYIRNVKVSGTVKLCECNQCHNKIFGGLSYCGNCGARMEKEG